jgi:GlpG protein
MVSGFVVAYCGRVAWPGSRCARIRGDRPLRQIGTLPRGIDPKIFADYLLTLGIKSRVDDRPEGWLVWIYNEDHVGRASDELQGYRAAPGDPRYQQAVDAAAAIRRREQDRDKEFRKNYREVSDLWAYPGLHRRPLTLALTAICVIVFILQNSSPNEHRAVENALLFSTTYRDREGRWHDSKLKEIQSGEVWRLVTPIIMHGSPLHIFFNMWWLVDLGTLIEIRRGTLRLALLILIAAIVSNFAQYLWMERGDPGGNHSFLGMSGVVYALFGYIWMKGLYQPEQGLILHPNTVTIMLAWLVLCMTGVVGPIANAAHFMGLVAGVAFGVLRY